MLLSAHLSRKSDDKDNHRKPTNEKLPFSLSQTISTT
uniref:Uncharacterized protein n=1 Tax=Rhizophora mucronata TaxID=61149 RepID=A0A2P2P9K5_RHIMU